MVKVWAKIVANVWHKVNKQWNPIKAAFENFNPSFHQSTTSSVFSYTLDHDLSTGLSYTAFELLGAQV